MNSFGLGFSFLRSKTTHHHQPPNQPLLPPIDLLSPSPTAAQPRRRSSPPTPLLSPEKIRSKQAPSRRETARLPAFPPVPHGPSNIDHERTLWGALQGATFGIPQGQQRAIKWCQSSTEECPLPVVSLPSSPSVSASAPLTTNKHRGVSPRKLVSVFVQGNTGLLYKPRMAPADVVPVSTNLTHISPSTPHQAYLYLPSSIP